MQREIDWFLICIELFLRTGTRILQGNLSVRFFLLFIWSHFVYIDSPLFAVCLKKECIAFHDSNIIYLKA